MRRSGRALWLLLACACNARGSDLAATPPTTTHGPAPASDAGAPAGPGAPDAGTSLDAFVLARMHASKRPGLSAVVLKNGVPIWQRGYGVGERDAPSPVSATTTLFPVSSMSKLVMLVVVLEVLEDVAAKKNVTLASLLDADVDTLVRKGPADTLHVRTPSFPGTPVTLRMILTHTSSIHNRYDLVPHNYPVAAPAFDAAAVPDLRLVHERYLTPGGLYFHADNFTSAPPGTAYEYSSVASSIAALVVDAQEGVSFATWCRTHVFEPLGMNDTTWRLAESPGLANGKLSLALPYEVVEDLVVKVVPPTWEHVFFPAASLRSTATDYAKFVGALMMGGKAPAGPRIVAEASLAEARRVQFPLIDTTQGLIVYFKKRAGFWVLGHGGANPGYLSEASFMDPDEPLPSQSKPTDLYGTVVLSNGDYDPEGASLLRDVESELLRRALADDASLQ